MKNVTTSTLILAAAALTFSVSPAFAQRPTKLKAEIPFSFHVGNQEYPAGAYETTVLESAFAARVLKIVNVETGDARLAMASISAYPGNAAEKESGPRLVFKCSGSGCALAQVWAGYETGIQFLTPSTKRNDPMRLAVVRLRPTSAD